MAKSSLWRSAGPLVAGRATSAAIGFVLPIILARQLDTASYGTYKQIFLIANLSLHSLQLGLAQSLFYFVPRTNSESERRQFVGQTQVMLALIGLAAFAGLVLATPLLAEKFSNPQLGELHVPLALLAASLVASASLEIALTSQGKPVFSAISLVASDVLRIVSMLGAIQLGYGIVGLTWAAALSAAARWAASLFACGGLSHLSLSKGRLRTQLVYSMPIGIAALLLFQQQQMHQVFVSAKATPALFALYAVGCMQIPVVSLLYTPVSETLQVRLAALESTGETHRAGEVFCDAVDKLALIFLPLCALLIATARPGLHVLYGGRYDDAAGVMRVAVLSVAVASLPLDGVFKARARTGALLCMYVVKLAVTWPLLAAGYAWLGLLGAISAHVAVELLTKTGQLAFISRDLKTPVSQMLGGRVMLRSIVLASLAGGLGAGAVELVPRFFAKMDWLQHEGPRFDGIARILNFFALPEFWSCIVAGLITAGLVLLEIRRRRTQPPSDIDVGMREAA